MELKEHTNHKPAESANAALGASHRNPAPVGVTVKTKIERGDAYSAPEIYDVEITLREIVQAEEALRRAKETGVINEPPQAGFDYVLVRMAVGYSRRGRGIGEEPYQLTPDQFAVTSKDGETVYANPVVTRQPQPPLVGEVFHPGDSREGWILLQTPSDEKKPLLIFNREFGEGVYGLWGYIWFQLYEDGF